MSLEENVINTFDASQSDNSILSYPLMNENLWGEFFRTCFNCETPKDIDTYTKLLSVCPILFDNFRERRDIGINGRLDVATVVHTIITKIKNRNFDRPIFLTGSAGTGKSISIKMLRNEFDKCDIECLVGAFTANAALQVEGTTIHKLMGLTPFTARSIISAIHKNRAWDKNEINRWNGSTYDFLFKNSIMVREKEWSTKKIQSVLKKCFDNFVGVRALILDEVSMMGDNLLEIIDVVLRYNFNRLAVPFGGVPVIMVGDFYQLPPVGAKRCFLSGCWEFSDPLIIQFDKPLRQISDYAWFNALEKIRLGGSISDCPSIERRVNILNTDVITHLKSLLPKDTTEWITAPQIPVILMSHRKKVDEINKNLFEVNPNPIQSTLASYQTILQPVTVRRVARDGSVQTQTVFRELHEGPAADNWLNHLKTTDTRVARLLDALEYDAPSSIPLKREAQFVVLKNINEHVVNGTTVIYDGNDLFRLRKNDQFHKPIHLRLFKTRKLVKIDANHYLRRDTFALRLGYAATIHASQGMTLDNAIVDIADSWMPGQTYVALSRVRTADGLVLVNGKSINKRVKSSPIVDKLYVKKQKISSC